MTRQNRRPAGLAPMRSEPPPSLSPQDRDTLPYHGDSGNNGGIACVSSRGALTAVALLGEPADEARRVAREPARQPPGQEARDPPREPRQRCDHDQRPVGADGTDRDRRNLVGSGGK